MQTYFHYNISRDRKRLRAGLVLIIAPLFQACLLAVLTLVFSLSCVADAENIVFLGAVACVCVLAGMLLCWGWYELISHRISANSRYTYFDIQPKTAIFSRYRGTHTAADGRAVLRVVYVIPLGDLGGVALTEAGGKKTFVEISGKIRRYTLDSEQLGYHIVDGEAVFDRWWLKFGAYEEISSVRIPCVFGSPARLAAELEAAKKRFDEIPPPKPHIFREADFIRRRPKPRVMPEDFSYNRKW